MTDSVCVCVFDLRRRRGGEKAERRKGAEIRAYAEQAKEIEGFND